MKLVRLMVLLFVGTSSTMAVASDMNPVYSHTKSYSFVVPEGWVSDIEKARLKKVDGVFYPKDGESNLRMSILEDPKNGKSLEQFVAEANANYTLHFPTDETLDVASDGIVMPVKIQKTTGGVGVSIKAYIDGPASVVSVVLIGLNEQELQNGMPAFKALINSYKTSTQDKKAL